MSRMNYDYDDFYKKRIMDGVGDETDDKLIT